MIATTHLNQSQATSELIQDSSMFQMERESKDATRYIEGEPKKSVSRRLRKKYKRLKHESSNVILNMQTENERLKIQIHDLQSTLNMRERQDNEVIQ